MESLMLSIHKQSTGFTLLELMLVISLTVLIIGMGKITFSEYYLYLLHNERAALLSLLATSRAQAIVNIRGLPHGLKISQDAYILFEGPSFSERDPTRDQVIPFSKVLERTGDTDFVFIPIKGSLSDRNVHTTEVSIAHHSIVVEVNEEGTVLW